MLGNQIISEYVNFNLFKDDTNAPSTFAKYQGLWKKHVKYFIVDDNTFGASKDFIPGLFVYPAFQKLCKENIKPVASYDCNLYAITKRMFDLDPFSFEKEVATFQHKMAEILHCDSFVASTKSFSGSDQNTVRTDISISKDGRKICLIELKRLLFGIQSDTNISNWSILL